MRWAFAIVLAACAPAKGPRPVLTTTGEQSGYTRTGHYDEAVKLCGDFARAYAGVRCETIGTTGEGRPLVALVIEKHAGLPVMYIEAGIHAGEIEGKDAGFWFLRDLLDGKVAPGALDRVSVAFVPVMNPDGHERFGKNNRPNQRGPEEMGFRTNGARLNLNRDFMKADAPETQAVLRLIAKYDAALLVDLHTTDGAKFETDISVTGGPYAPRPDGLEKTYQALSRSVIARLAQLGHLPVDFYPSFVDDKDPMSGFGIGEGRPRFSHFYMGVRNRLGMLVETHSWRTYKERAQSTYHALQAVFEEATRSAASWRTAERAADAAKLGGAPMTVQWDNGKGHHDIAFRGYAFQIVHSELTAGDWIKYDETKPQVWTVPLYDEEVAKVTVTPPRAGYIIDGGYAAIAKAVLDRHGIESVAIAGAPTVAVNVYRATKVAFGPSYEGHSPPKLEGAWGDEKRTLDAGALFVPIDQPHARLAVQLLEPEAPDSLTAWGLFNTAFEQKEYIEPYVIEPWAAQKVAADPELKAAFDAAVAADPELAKSVDAKRDWFYRHHPASDERWNLVPVYRAAVATWTLKP